MFPGFYRRFKEQISYETLEKACKRTIQLLGLTRLNHKGLHSLEHAMMPGTKLECLGSEKKLSAPDELSCDGPLQLIKPLLRRRNLIPAFCRPIPPQLSPGQHHLKFTSTSQTSVRDGTSCLQKRRAPEPDLVRIKTSRFFFELS
jgi:hypothetical protein